MLTIAYFTSRKEPKLEWFLDSLHRETKGDYTDIRIVIVDRWHDAGKISLEDRFLHVPPKPTVWQGPHRLTKADYFAASNARNTAICLAPDGYLAFVDDLSVLMPGWLEAVREAMAGNYIACGAYRKVKDMVVQKGQLVSFTDHPLGIDHRWQHGHPRHALPCVGAWMFGCSLAAPVEAFLQINGYPEACDSMGYEDSICGATIERNGYHFRYDQRMLSYESEDLHSQLPVMRREDPGVSPNDMSHAMLQMYSRAKRFDNWFGADGIRGLRTRVLAGEPFPIMKIPEHRWFDAAPLRSLPVGFEEESVEL